MGVCAHGRASGYVDVGVLCVLCCVCVQLRLLGNGLRIWREFPTKSECTI